MEYDTVAEIPATLGQRNDVVSKWMAMDAISSGMALALRIAFV